MLRYQVSQQGVRKYKIVGSKQDIYMSRVGREYANNMCKTFYKMCLDNHLVYGLCV